MEEDYPAKQQMQVGITEFISVGKIVPAVTKYLLSDFIVNEIDIHQQVVVLQSKPGKIHTDNEVKQVSYQMTPQLKQEITLILGESVAESIAQLYERLDCGEKSCWEFQLQPAYDKAQRIKIHEFVRQKLVNIESTAREGGKLKLKFNKKLRKMNPLARQKYTHFKLFKHGIDTFNAIFRLSKITGISNKLFSTAGLKDKRGITTQLVSVYNTDLDSLKKFYKQADRNREMWIDQFEQCKDDKISVGGLFGNQFGLILRLIDPADAEVVSERVESLGKIGMINYFGMQRFGQFSVKTHELGAMVIRREWKQLIQNLILSDCGNFQVNIDKRQLYQSKQYAKAERILSNKYKIQKLIFKSLSRQRQNYQNVFQSLPRNIKTLYVHALQSYIWNKITSRRIKQHGLKLIIGDLVGIQNKQETKKQIIDQIEEDEDQIIEDDAVDEDDIEIQLITEDNLSKYSIYDLVAPLYGPSSLIPQTSILFKYIQDELYKLNLTNDDFIKNSKLLCFQGQFRRMIVQPKVSHKIITHQHHKQQLQSAFYMKEDIKHEEGNLKAVQVVLQLPKSSYATMAIRQILHISSDFDTQMQLNRAYEKRCQPQKQ